MNGTETAVVQIGSIAISSGAVIFIMKWLVPYIIQLWYERRQQDTLEKRKNLLIMAENEKMKQEKNDDAIKACRAMVEILNTAVNSINRDVGSLRTSLTHTDERIAEFLSYMPVLERVKLALEAIDRRKREGGRPAPPQKGAFPEQEHIQQGDTTIIRTKKPPSSGNTGG